MIRNNNYINKIVSKILSKGLISYLNIVEDSDSVIVEYIAKDDDSDITFLEDIIESNITQDCRVRRLKL